MSKSKRVRAFIGALVAIILMIVIAASVAAGFWLSERRQVHRPIQPVLDAIARACAWEDDGRTHTATSGDGWVVAGNPQAMCWGWEITPYGYRGSDRVLYDVIGSSDLLIDITELKDRQAVHELLTDRLTTLLGGFPGAVSKTLSAGAVSIMSSTTGGATMMNLRRVGPSTFRCDWGNAEGMDGLLMGGDTWNQIYWASSPGYHASVSGRIYDFEDDERHPVKTLADPIRGRRFLWVTISMAAYGFSEPGTLNHQLETGASRVRDW